MNDSLAQYMGVSNTLGQLSHFLEEWDRDEATIRSISISDEVGPITDESISAEVTLEIPVLATSGESDAIVECTPSVTRDGALGLNLETTLSVTNTGRYRVDVEPADATLDTDGTATVTIRLTVSDMHDQFNDEQPTVSEPSDGTQFPEREKEDNHSSAEIQERDVPPFRDPELLRNIYETHDTFAEMAEALDMSVTGETVRRYMIDYDIHQPNSYESESVDSPRSPAVEGQTEEIHAAALELPEHVTVEELIETVSEANTIYQVKEAFDLERSEAHTMLKELNLVELVMGRLANDKGRDTTPEDVIERLQEVAQTKTH
jgi:hypothetical protein